MAFAVSQGIKRHAPCLPTLVRRSIVRSARLACGVCGVASCRTGPQGNNPQELRIADIPSGNERMLTSLPAGFAGGALVWSSADDGLLYEVHSTASFPGAGGGPRSSRLESYDLLATQAPGATDGSLMLTDGRVFIPLAWDRSGALCSALTTGEGGYAIDYMTWDRRALPAGQS